MQPGIGAKTTLVFCTLVLMCIGMSAQRANSDDEEITPPPPSPPSPVVLQRSMMPILYLLLLDDGDTSGITPPLPGNGDYVLLAANDLGMHCADQDYQIFSILPPFNVVHSQVIQRGNSPLLMSDAGIELTYQAISSPVDPAGSGSLNTTSSNSAGFKSNFWEDSGVAIPLSFKSGNKSRGGLNYEGLFPSVLAGSMLTPAENWLAECGDTSTPTDCPSILNVFEPLPTETGLPVPDTEKLDSGILAVTQQSMPGISNIPQKFKRFDRDVHFFTQFDFGAVVHDANWWAADGVPITPVDDSGKSNAYPLMRIVAKASADGTALAGLDTVLPVASEADCQNCHAKQLDCMDPSLPPEIISDACNESGLQNLPSSSIMDIDNAPGDRPEQKLLNAAKINILRLHDVKHGAQYTAANGTARACDPANDPDKHCLDSRRAIQCAQCHYTPALDLTQKGPADEPQQGPNGRQQTRHISMSSAMHGFHGSLPQWQGQDLFPAMPGPAGRNPVTANTILEQTCYQCHPGKRTKCLRGAMGSAGVVCQDCHGDMMQVGNDFSLRVSTTNPGDFILDGSLRVPWASEPGCQSCHTGDARTLNHPTGAIVAPDGIRLLQAYATQNISVTGVGTVKTAAVIKSPGSRFAENQAQNSNGDTIDLLYRLSKGHGGVMCEGCHNSTHAVWPVNPANANDNIAANQLQGHQGTVIECSTCHTGDLGNTLDGPHGMHPVGGGRFADGGHEDLAESNGNACRACHGNNGEGTILSKVATIRSFVIEECENGSLCPGGDTNDFLVNLNQGDLVSCGMCHENPL